MDWDWPKDSGRRTWQFVAPSKLDPARDGWFAVWAELAGDNGGNVRLCGALASSSDADDLSILLRRGHGWSSLLAVSCFERLRPRWLSYRPSAATRQWAPTHAGPFLVKLRGGSVVKLISLFEQRPLLRVPKRRPTSPSELRCQSRPATR